MTDQLLDFSPETVEWRSSVFLKDRQLLGQFMTPRFLRTYLLEQLDMKEGDRVQSFLFNLVLFGMVLLGSLGIVIASG